MAACVDGGLSGSKVAQAMILPPSDFRFAYKLQVECGAQTTAPYDEDPVPGMANWPWIELPENVTGNDLYPLCGETAPDESPGVIPGEFAAKSAPGATLAEVSWNLLGVPGRASTADLDVDVEYSISPCGRSECVSIAKFAATTPDTEILGFEVSDIQLEVEEVASAPVLGRSRFTFEPGTLRAMLNYRANDTGHATDGYNTSAVKGTLSGDTLSLRGVEFQFGNDVVSAVLRLDISARLVQQPPGATIAVFDTPSRCSEPVVLQSRSKDPEELPIQENLWLSPAGPHTGEYLELLLDNGEEAFVALISQDATGRTASTGLRYTRRCH